MLLVGKDLASYTLAAGEPFVLEVQLLDSAGRGIDLDDQAMVLTFYSASTREVVTDFAGNPSQYEGTRLSDATGEYFRWAFDGRWSDVMLNRPGLRVELSQRLFYGRRIISTGTLSVVSSAAVVPSLSGGSIALTAVRVTIKDNPLLGGPPLISQLVILYDAPIIPVPAPEFTTPTSIASDGTPQVGELLTGIDGVATNAASYTRRWLLGSSVLTGSATYTPTSVGTYRYETIATGPGGETTSGSNITVAAASPVLNALTISPSTATVGTSTTIAISGATAGSVITGTVPAGMTLNSAARTITGTPTTAGSPSIVLTETLAGAIGSPRQSTVGVTIAAAPVTPVLGALTVSPSAATVGTAYSGTINGLTSGSSIALSGAGAAGLSIAGGVITGTPTTAGAVNIIETLAGATGSPRTSSGVVTVAASAQLVASSPSPKLLSNAPAGTLITNVTGVPSGVTPTISPNDGRFVVAGDATNGWKVVAGSTAVSAGSVNLTISATGATSASASLTIVQFLGYHRVGSWGQSNEIGRNGPIDPILDAPDYRIYSFGFDSQTVTQANLQLDYQDETPNTVGPIMSFAKAYIAAGNLPDGYALLIVPVAKGNTAFSTGFWDAGGAGDTAAIARMNAAAALASGIWIGQSGTLGEGDRTQTQSYFAGKIDALITRWRASITDAANMPFLMGGLLVGGAQTAAPIVAALQDLPNRVAFTGYISSVGLTGGSDNIHLDAPSQRTSGQRRYDGLAAAKANNLAPTAPAQVTGLNGTPSSGQVSLAWTAPSSNRSAITDYIVEYKASSSSTWLTFADGTSTATTATVTGLTNSTAYDFRVSAVNAIGTGPVSSIATYTPAAAPAGGLNATFAAPDNTTAGSYTTDSGHSITQTTGVSQIRNNALAGTTVPSEGTFSYVPASINEPIRWRTIVNTKAGNCYMKSRQVGANYYYAGCGSNGSFHTLASLINSQADNFAGGTSSTPAITAGDVLDYEWTVSGPNGSEFHNLKVSVNGAAAVQVFSASPPAATQSALSAIGTIGFRQSSATSSATTGLQLDNVTVTPV